ncbi:MAG: TetR/AcrR family transcriptional regulator [Variovorax sp.]|nr:TetR/AcrR family transcriptional regulator [Variovorax sp.]
MKSTVKTPTQRSVSVKAAAGTAVPNRAAPLSAKMPEKVTPIAAGKQTPRRLRRAAEILSAAREVFLEKGFERSSVSEIAARVGVVEGLVYAYFPTKRDLLNEVLRGMYEPLIRDMADSFSRIEGLRSRLRFLVWRHLRVYVEEPSLSRIVLHEVRTSPEYFKSVLHDLQVRYTSFLLRTVREAMDEGELPPDTDVETVRSMVYGGIEHRMWSLLYGRGTIDVEATADRYTAMLLRGVLAPCCDEAGATQPAASAALGASRTRGVLERRLARLEQIVAAGLAPVAPVSAARAARRRKDAP